MSITLQTGLQQVRNSDKPITKAWELAYDFLLLEDKVLKLIQILSEHENLFITSNAYHNHYHTAEVVWASAFLIKNEDIYHKRYDSQVILLLASTFHDADHRGKSNRFPYEQEKISSFFFMEWWRNNSLFVENILSIKHDDIENAINNLILLTDFEEGQRISDKSYKEDKQLILYDVEFNKLSKILIEADMLLNVLPNSGFDKITLILKEAGKNLPDSTKWDYLKSFLLETSIFFNSDASVRLKIESNSLKLSKFINDNRDFISTNMLQKLINENIKSF